jgi:hypothetical protein
MLAKTNNCLREGAKQGTKKHEGAKRQNHTSLQKSAINEKEIN